MHRDYKLFISIFSPALSLVREQGRLILIANVVSLKYKLRQEAMEKSFAVVEFPDDSTVEVVSTQWLDKNKSFCHWPSSNGPTLKKLVITHCKPAKDWKVFRCRVLRVYGKLYVSEV